VCGSKKWHKVLPPPFCAGHSEEEISGTRHMKVHLSERLGQLRCAVQMLGGSG
jgi:hypothetical protein